MRGEKEGWKEGKGKGGKEGKGRIRNRRGWKGKIKGEGRRRTR